MRRIAAKINVARIIGRFGSIIRRDAGNDLAVGFELEPSLSIGTTRAASEELPTSEIQPSERKLGFNGAAADREGRCLLLIFVADADDVDRQFRQLVVWSFEERF